MAGMFYSLEEVAEKLNKTEDEIKQIVQQGRLREFRDGSNLLFKVDEVETLMTDTDTTEASEEKAEPQEQPQEEELVVEAQPQQEEELVVEEQPQQEEELIVQAQPQQEAFEQEPFEELLQDQQQDEEPLQMAPEEDLALAPQPEAEELTDDETIFSDEGINILDETTEQLSVTDDMMAISDDTMEVAADDTMAVTDDDTTSIIGEVAEETAVESSQVELESPELLEETSVTPSDESFLGSTGEASLQQIEDDVNLDTFGSGSGLLDLSLQADDTSLGGILDEIYTPEGDEQHADASFGAGSVMDATATQEMLAEVSQPDVNAAAIARMYAEPTPDTQSNILGMMLLLPLLAMLYAAIVTIAGLSNTMPTILSKIQGTIWYIVAGFAVVEVALLVVAFMTGSAGAKPAKKAKPKKAKKAKKEKKPKEPKKKKEKKTKKEKKKKK